MQSKYKWLLVPPALALVLVLGPLGSNSFGQAAAVPNSGSNPAASSGAPTTASDPAQGPGSAAQQPSSAATSLDTRTTRNTAARDTRKTPMLKTSAPSVWQVIATLLGVLTLGGVGLVLVKRVRFPKRPQQAGEFATLRQTVHLTPKHLVHAVEFDGQVLLVGSFDSGMSLLAASPIQDAAEADREDIRRRYVAQNAELDDDGGAVPRDMVIPRPAAAPRTVLPTPPATRGTPAQTASGRPPMPIPRPVERAVSGDNRTNNFKSLLTRSGKASEVIV